MGMRILLNDFCNHKIIQLTTVTRKKEIIKRVLYEMLLLNKINHSKLYFYSF